MEVLLIKTKRKTILVVFGTRPEAIKMAPLVRALEATDLLNVITCVTAQHRELLDQVLTTFGIIPEIDLDLMSKNQDLFDVTSSALLGVRDVIRRVRPDAVLVHGDTTTTFAAGLAAFYEQVPVGHVEAGLRTGDFSAPFPEEFNRVSTDRISRWHFAPTSEARSNLLAEGIDDDRVWVTGNTVVDALNICLDDIASNLDLRVEIETLLDNQLHADWKESKIVLVTMHRRENFGAGLSNVRRALQRLASMHSDAVFVFPVHPNPNVRDEMLDAFEGMTNVVLTEPMGYQEFAWLLRHTHLVLTDSGGLQEEAPILGKPVLLMRDSTERPEGVTAGCVELVGTDEDLIIASVSSLLQNPDRYESMSGGANLYGDGEAAQMIAQIMVRELFKIV